MRGADAGEPARLSAVMTDTEMQLEKCRFILPINGAGVHAAISSKPSLCLLVATLGAKTVSRSGRRTGVTSALCEVLGGIDALAKRNRRPVATGARLAGRSRHRGRDLFLPDSTLARESPGGIAELPNPDRYSAVASCGACGALRRGMDDQILDYAFPGTVFDPEIIQVLASAFDDAWEKIEKSRSRFARPGYSRAMREVIAKRIFEMAQQGVTDPQALAEDAVRFVRANYKDDLSGKA